MAFGGQYPIWVDINSCIYKQKKSYGVKNHSEQNIRVGTSSKNSHEFATVQLNHEELENGSRIYKLYVDGVLVKSARLERGAEKIDVQKELKGVL